MTCGIWKRSLLPSGFISLSQPQCLQDGSQLLVPGSRASWTGGAHRDPPWRAQRLPRVLIRESLLLAPLFPNCPNWLSRGKEAWGRVTMVCRSGVHGKKDRIQTLVLSLNIIPWPKGRKLEGLKGKLGCMLGCGQGHRKERGLGVTGKRILVLPVGIKLEQVGYLHSS